MKILTSFVCLTIICSCASNTTITPIQAKESLYRRLGERQGLTVVVDEFVANVTNDKRLKAAFSKTTKDKKRVAALKTHLVTQLCEATGGPCKYDGKDMKSAHKGMKINDAQFDALVEDLGKALDKYRVGEAEKGELVATLAPLRPLIVEKGASAKNVTRNKS